MKVRIEYGVPSHLAPMLVAIPKWGGGLNLFKVRPDTLRFTPFADALIALFVREGVAPQKAA